MWKLAGKKKGRKTEKSRYNQKNQLVRRENEEESWNYTFDSQRNLIRETSPKKERQYLYDTETEQYYLRARYYNPVLGRFMQEDTYQGDGLNLYAYCANNPVMYYDPSGNEGVCGHDEDAGKNAQQENITEEKGLIKEGLGKISGKKYKITQKGLDFIKQYLSEQGFIGDYENQDMIKRLESALASGEKITGADAIFYTHEIKEALLVSSGIPQEDAHKMALKYYEVSPFSVYHPDVIKKESGWWNDKWFEFWEIER